MRIAENGPGHTCCRDVRRPARSATAPPRGDEAETRKLRAKRLVDAGRPLQGLKALSSLGVATGADVIAKLRDLLELPRPAVAEGTAPEYLVPPTPVGQLQFTEQWARAALSALQAGTAAGVDGLFPEAIIGISREPEVVEAFAAFGTAVLEGRLDTEAAAVLRDVLVTPLRKISNDIRAISVQSVWLRSIARSAAHRAAKVLAPFLQEHGQLAFGVPDAAAVWIAAMDAAPADFAYAKFDYTNAFPMLDMQQAMRAVEAAAPGLMGYMRTAYGAPPRAFVRSQAAPVCNITGPPQGGPEVPLIFCLATLPALRAARAVAGPRAVIRGYIDDIGGRMAPDRLVAVRKVLMQEAAKVGMALKESKTLSTVAAEGYTHSRAGGIVLLGVPVGADAYRQQQSELIAGEAWTETQAMLQNDMMSMHARAYALRAAGAHARLGHLMRAVPPYLLHASLQRADEQAAIAIRQLGKLSQDERLPLPTQPAWPLALGGLASGGTLRTAPAAYLCSTIAARRRPARCNTPAGAHTAATQQQSGPERCTCGEAVAKGCARAKCAVCCGAVSTECQSCRAPARLDTSAPDLADALARLAASLGTTHAGAGRALAAAMTRHRKAQRLLTRTIWARARTTEVAALPEGVRLHMHAHLNSAADSLASAWLHRAPYPGASLTADATAVAVRTRLALRCTQRVVACTCANCRAPVAAGGAARPLHVGDAMARICCAPGRSSGTRQHNNARDALAMVLRRYDVHVSVEFNPPVIPEAVAAAAGVAAARAARAERRGTDQRPGDVAIRTQGITLMIDMTKVECDSRDDVLRRALASGQTDAFDKARRTKEVAYPEREVWRAHGFDYVVLPIGKPVGNTDAAGRKLLGRLATEASRCSGAPWSEAYADICSTLAVDGMNQLALCYARNEGVARIPHAALLPYHHPG